jgi:hypothetical protein
VVHGEVDELLSSINRLRIDCERALEIAAAKQGVEEVKVEPPLKKLRCLKSWEARKEQVELSVAERNVYKLVKEKGRGWAIVQDTDGARGRAPMGAFRAKSPSPSPEDLVQPAEPSESAAPLSPERPPVENDDHTAASTPLSRRHALSNEEIRGEGSSGAEHASGWAHLEGGQNPQVSFTNVIWKLAWHSCGTLQVKLQEAVNRCPRCLSSEKIQSVRTPYILAILCSKKIGKALDSTEV